MSVEMIAAADTGFDDSITQYPLKAVLLVIAFNNLTLRIILTQDL